MHLPPGSAIHVFVASPGTAPPRLYHGICWDLSKSDLAIACFVSPNSRVTDDSHRGLSRTSGRQSIIFVRKARRARPADDRVHPAVLQWAQRDYSRLMRPGSKTLLRCAPSLRSKVGGRTLAGVAIACLASYPPPTLRLGRRWGTLRTAVRRPGLASPHRPPSGDRAIHAPLGRPRNNRKI